MAFQTTALAKALNSLRSATQQPVNEYIRDSVIKRFEYSYELAWKLMKRFLETEVVVAADLSTRRELFRVAQQNGLITDIDEWMDFHRARNETTHTYNETTAQDVYNTALRFLPEAERLLNEIDARTT